MAKVLLDTDILSEILKAKNAAVAAKAAAYLAEHGRFTTSAVTVAEIVYGLRRIGSEDRVALFEASTTGACPEREAVDLRHESHAEYSARG